MSAADPVPTPSTLRKLHDEALKDLGRARLAGIDLLAAGVAHEVNNPLAFVSANLQLLGQGLDLCRRALAGEPLSAEERADLTFVLAEGSQVAREAQGGCARIGQVVRRLAAFATPQGERPIDLQRLVGDVVRLARAGGGRNLTLDLDLVPVPAINGAPERLGHAICTLVEHASDMAMTAGLGIARVSVRLAAAASATATVLDIGDRGPPPTSALLEGLEDPFGVPGPNRTAALGLALARQIVHEHRGNLTIEENPGGGTLRRVIFPAA